MSVLFSNYRKLFRVSHRVSLSPGVITDKETMRHQEILLVLNKETRIPKDSHGLLVKFYQALLPASCYLGLMVAAPRDHETTREKLKKFENFQVDNFLILRDPHMITIPFEQKHRIIYISIQFITFFTFLI